MDVLRVFRREQIERALEGLDLLPAMAQAFTDWSDGRAQLAAVGELVMSNPPGDIHIKAGHIEGDENYLVKVAAGFYDNPAKGLPSSSGLSLLFDASNGHLNTLLLDDGLLTDERTAAAGALAAQRLARSDSETIAVLGGGIQAHLQLKHLRAVTSARRVLIWTRWGKGTERLARLARSLGFTCHAAQTAAQAVGEADIVVTATPSEAPLISSKDVRPGTHITAVGADSAHKGELAVDLLLAADLIVADSLPQCRVRGELRRALGRTGDVCELGSVIAGRHPGRTAPNQITIADLTGLAVQDIAIARIVLDALDQQG